MLEAARQRACQPGQGVRAVGAVVMARTMARAEAKALKAVAVRTRRRLEVENPAPEGGA